jgi:hypothetical protein
MSQPPVTVGLRLCPTTKGELQALMGALGAAGENLRQEDVVGALLRRAQEAIDDERKLERLASDARAHRKRSKTEGF